MHKVPKFLQLLLSSDDVESAEYRAAVAQLEREPKWYKTLEELALGDSAWWPEARTALAENGVPASDILGIQGVVDGRSTNKSLGGHSRDTDRDHVQAAAITIEIESSLAHDVPIDCEQVSLDFLDPPSHPELLGRIDRYEIERVLGTGGMGVVLRAFDTDLHRVVAIKVLAAHLAHHSSARRRFAREAQAAAAVVHPHVIPIFNVQSDAKTPYIVMQYVAGQSLQRRVDVAGPLPIVDALRIAQQTAAGLTAAHQQGLVHRDVKPANILLEEQIDRVMLSDFGLARAVDDASLTRTGIVAGTPHYMSPEQALGEAIDHRSDLFSLGSVLYFTLAGHPPFRASSAMGVLHRICQFAHRPLVEVNRDVPIEVSQLVDRLLAKKPSDRIATAAEAERELASLLSNLQQRGVSIQSRETRNRLDGFVSRLTTLMMGQPGHIGLLGRLMLLSTACLGLIVLGRQLPDALANWIHASRLTAQQVAQPGNAENRNASNNITVLADANALVDSASRPDLSNENAQRNRFLFESTELTQSNLDEYAQWTEEAATFHVEVARVQRELELLQTQLSQFTFSSDEFEDEVHQIQAAIVELTRQLQAHE